MGSLGVGFRLKLCPERRFRIVETLPKTILIFMNKNNPGDIDISPSSSGLQRYQQSCLEDDKLLKKYPKWAPNTKTCWSICFSTPIEPSGLATASIRVFLNGFFCAVFRMSPNFKSLCESSFIRWIRKSTVLNQRVSLEWIIFSTILSRNEVQSYDPCPGESSRRGLE